ncbi:glycosyl hydrolase family 28-related protein [Yersinia intermedia]|uniref:glycosyl hydrolase family 28-related protein n=1 Tax=Yersinia intermedia TaxID=631 RepID=UPI001E63D85B|nr:glycosyl hydrolase family 28-related protein [Yersinia intermedia]
MSAYPVGSLGKRAQYIICASDKPFNADPTFTTDSYAAIQGAIDHAVESGASVVWLPTGRYKVSKGIVIPAGITLVGDGGDYWDTFRPSPDRLLKSWDKGTHLVFAGTGAKTENIQNIMNARTPKIVDGISYPLTDFTNNDSVGGSPATPKLFSAAVKATHASQIKNLRIMLNNHGIEGYNDAASLSLGDNWDVGLWVFDGNSAIVDTVQVVGYWRIAGILLTENDGSYSTVGNPESATFNNVLTQGRRGLLIRNAAQIDVYSNTDTTVTALYNSSFTLTADMRFRTGNNSQIYRFTGYSVNNATITLTGVSPNLPASVTVLRAANIGNNFSGTVFSNFKACSLDHTSGNNSAFLGLGEAGAMEIDGYPIRNLKFINFKAQTTFDRLNTIFGDMKDAKFVSCEHENGAMIAYNNSETIGFTGNIRFTNSDIQPSTNISAFTPRDCSIDYKQMPTQNTDGAFIIKNWRANNLNIQYADGKSGVLLRDSDKNAQLSNGTGFMYLRSAGSTDGLDLFGASFAIRDSTGVAFLQGFSTLNITGPGTLSMSNFAVSSGGVVRGATPNTAYCGDAAHPWAGGYTQTGFSITSNMLDKQDIKLFTDEILDAWGHVDWYSYRLIDAVARKGEQARSHAGLLAQEIMAVFQTYDLDSENLGLVCYESWPESVEIIDGKEVTVPAGDSYSVRYTEALCIEAAFNRRERTRLEARIAALEKQS